MIDLKYMPELVKDKVALSVFEQMNFGKWLKKAVKYLFSEDSLQLMMDCFEIDREDLTDDVVMDFKEYLFREICIVVINDWWNSDPKEVVFEDEWYKQEFYAPLNNRFIKWRDVYDTMLGEWIIYYLHRYINILEKEKGMTPLTFLSEINKCLGFYTIYTFQNTLFERFVVARDDLLHSEEV